jgi:hypothetical protein
LANIRLAAVIPLIRDLGPHLGGPEQHAFGVPLISIAISHVYLWLQYL